MNERLRRLRRILELTQQEFAEKIGIKRNTMATYESGRNDPIDAVISLICREFNVSETWLRTGEGEMFLPVNPGKQLTDFVKEVLQDGNSFKQHFLEKLMSLSEDEWRILEKIMK